ncbi:MAG: ABC transporter substrate-binding protein, partial [Candidatus Rokubacteria bacterium]|nr:ABC transporter substrate-binding protein [Candidatus Rokubacteria bacterium]
MRRVAIVLGCVLLLGSSAESFTVRDMLGRDVALSAPPRRIVSLVPSVTEILYGLGAEELVAGVTTL